MMFKYYGQSVPAPELTRGFGCKIQNRLMSGFYAKDFVFGRKACLLTISVLQESFFSSGALLRWLQ